MYVSYFPIGLGDHSPRIDCGRDFVEKPRSTRSVTSVIIMLLPSGVLTTYAEKLSLWSVGEKYTRECGYTTIRDNSTHYLLLQNVFLERVTFFRCGVRMSNNMVRNSSYIRIPQRDWRDSLRACRRLAIIGRGFASGTRLAADSIFTLVWSHDCVLYYRQQESRLGLLFFVAFLLKLSSKYCNLLTRHNAWAWCKSTLRQLLSDSGNKARLDLVSMWRVAD